MFPVGPDASQGCDDLSTMQVRELLVGDAAGGDGVEGKTAGGCSAPDEEAEQMPRPTGKISFWPGVWDTLGPHLPSGNYLV